MTWQVELFNYIFWKNKKNKKKINLNRRRKKSIKTKTLLTKYFKEILNNEMYGNNTIMYQ